MNVSCNTRMRWKSAAVAVLALACFSCSKQRPVTAPPAGFVSQIKQVDFVLVTNRPWNLGYSLNGEDARKLVEVLSQAQIERNGVPGIFDWSLQFYAGTNLVADVPFQDRAFFAGQELFIEQSGLLARVYREACSIPINWKAKERP